ncbi:MAG: peptidoglycan DD-metalloendopeptidase family protein [Chlorobiaceae bacterium]|nr:peptidoglycan DD-metalloendopeptidase family protein [Chlorobiaceae bacterium]
MLAGAFAFRPADSFAAGQDMNRIVQERNRVEGNLKGLKKQLEEYQQKLNRTRKDEASSMKALNNIRTQILVYQKLITENQAYLNSLDRQIDVLHQELDVNRQNYGRVSNDFQRLAIAAYKRGGNRDAELVLSSGSVNDALVRSRYMGFMSQSVKHKVNDLQTSAEQIQSAQAQLQESYRQKESAMKAQQAQLKDYSSKQKEKETVLSSIKEDKMTYAARITEVRRKQKAMQSKIESLIMAQQSIIQKEQDRARQAALLREKARLAKLAEQKRFEAERQRKAFAEQRRQQDLRQAEARQAATRQAEARRSEPRTVAPRAKVTDIRLPQVGNAPGGPARPEPKLASRAEPRAEPKQEPRTEPKPESQPVVEKATVREEPPRAVVDVEETEIAKVSADFDSAMGRLPWPVGNGVVVRHFGALKDKELNIVTTSNGIDISVPVNSSVKAISGGKVAQIAYLPTFGNVVIVRHPKSYLTVYANLSRVAVAKGEVIRAGHQLGASAATTEGGSVVHFEIWKGKVKQNPEKWLR